mmetsp:Transcript_558/g.1484  ORF Transcript_558/g.1484 Transcript_558/m.1484 type:complete len:289 (-) Transcript_558:36-902(-)
MHRLHQRQTVGSDVSTRRQTQSADQPGRQIGDDVAVQVGHHHDIKLARITHQLHARVVHNHLLVHDIRVLFRHFATAAYEQTVRQLHDVGLVHTRHLFAAMLGGILEGKLRHARRRRRRNHLERLHHARHHLVLQPAILSLRVLPHSHQIHVIVPRLVPRNTQTRPHVRIQLQLFPQRQVQRPESLPDRRRHRPLQPDPVLQHGIQVCPRDERVRLRVHLLADALLLPLDRRLGSLEDGHHRLGDLRTDPIPGKQGGRDLLVRRCICPHSALRGGNRRRLLCRATCDQ